MRDKGLFILNSPFFLETHGLQFFNKTKGHSMAEKSKETDEKPFIDDKG
jgi:hypothetical protein